MGDCIGDYYRGFQGDTGSLDPRPYTIRGIRRMLGVFTIALLGRGGCSSFYIKA